MWLSACQSYPREPVEPLVPAGTIITLTASVPVRANYSRVVFQDGNVVDKPNLYRTWCTLYLYRPRSDMPNNAVVEPDNFTVNDVQRYIDYSWSAPLWYAHYGGMIRWSDRSSMTLSTHFDIHSDRQPQVRRLVCSIFADPIDRVFPRMPEIRAAVGELIKFPEWTPDGDANQENTAFRTLD